MEDANQTNNKEKAKKNKTKMQGKYKDNKEDQRKTRKI